MNYSRMMLNEARENYRQTKEITAQVRRNVSGIYNGHDLSQMLNQCRRAKRDLRVAIKHTEEYLEACKLRKQARRAARVAKEFQRHNEQWAERLR